MKTALELLATGDWYSSPDRHGDLLLSCVNPRAGIVKKLTSEHRVCMALLWGMVVALADVRVDSMLSGLFRGMAEGWLRGDALKRYHDKDLAWFNEVVKDKSHWLYPYRKAHWSKGRLSKP